MTMQRMRPFDLVEELLREWGSNQRSREFYTGLGKSIQESVREFCVLGKIIAKTNYVKPKPPPVLTSRLEVVHLDGLIHQCTPRTRQALYGRYVLQMSNREVSIALGVSTRTVYRDLLVARKFFTSVMKCSNIAYNGNRC